MSGPRADTGDTAALPEGFDRRYVSEARPYTIWDAPRAVKRVFSKFPLTTASSEQQPAYLTRLDRVQKSRGKRIQFWANTLVEDPRIPSYNVNCLKYQALLLAKDLRFDVVRTSSDGAPDGRLPFLLTTNASKQLNIVRSAGVEKFVADRENASGDGEAAESAQEQRYRQMEGLGILDKDIRAAWLYSCYLTPENFRNVVFKLYVSSVTHARLSHYAMLNNIYNDAREEFSKLEPTPDIGRSSWRDPAPPSHLDLAIMLNRKAGTALDHLVALLDGQTFFSGSDTPDLLDCAVFAYTHLLTQHEFTDDIQWVDRRLGDEFRRRKALIAHEEAVYDYCFGERDHVPRAQSSLRESRHSFENVQARSAYTESQTSFSEINESSYQDSQHSYDEITHSTFPSESQESYAEMTESQLPERQPDMPRYTEHEAAAPSVLQEPVPPTVEEEIAGTNEGPPAMTSSALFG